MKGLNRICRYLMANLPGEGTKRTRQPVVTGTKRNVPEAVEEQNTAKLYL